MYSDAVSRPTSRHFDHLQKEKSSRDIPCLRNDDNEADGLDRLIGMIRAEGRSVPSIVFVTRY